MYIKADIPVRLLVYALFLLSCLAAAAAAGQWDGGFDISVGSLIVGQSHIQLATFYAIE